MGEPQHAVVIDRVPIDGWTLAVMEDGGQGDPMASMFAGSWLGYVDLRCRVPSGEAAFTIEVWDTRPGEVSGWEDADELPFQCAAAGHVRLVNGMEGPPVDLSAHERWRVRVLARNRSSASLSDERPQAWFLQFWPDAENLDALAGPPRRLAGMDATERELTDDWYFSEEQEVAQIIRWASKDQPLPSIRQMAARLGMSRSSVRGGLLTVDRFVTQRLAESPFPAGLPQEDHEAVTFVWPAGLGRKYDATSARA